MLRNIITGLIMFCISLPSNPQNITTVKELLSAVVKAMGGETAWRNIKTMELKQVANGGQLGNGMITITTRYPGFYKYEYHHSERDFFLYGLFVPGQIPISWIVMNGDARENRPPNSRSLLFALDEMNMLYDSTWQLKPLKTEIKEGKSYYVVEGSFKELYQKKYYNSETFLPEKMEQVVEGRKTVSEFSDYRQTDGVTWAWLIRREVDDPQTGRSQSEDKVVSLKFNGAPADDIFIRR